MRTGVINIKSFINAGFRFDPDIHLSEGSVVRNELKHLPYQLSTVGENASDVFLGNIFTRVFVQKPDHGVPYLAAKETVLSNIETGRFLSKKQASQLSYLILKKDWILVTCSGTLGNVVYTNNNYENHIATHDLIRIVPNSKRVNKGTLYAFLSGRYGYYQITQSQFGGVVKHINAEQTKSIIVPVFPDEFQREVDDLIQESAHLREEAAAFLGQAHQIIENRIKLNQERKPSQVSISSILKSHDLRFEAAYYTSENRSIYDFITSTFKYNKLGNLTLNIFRPGIFKREYVSNGVMFLGGSDILRTIPKSDKKLSFRQVARMPELKVEKGWILVTCGGTIGNTVLIDKQLEKCAISQHVMRIVPNDKILKGYLYAFLSSNIGKELITMFSTGSVIPQIEAPHLELVPIPIFEKELMIQIDKLVENYVSRIETSKEYETKAIAMVEEEIEKWNK